MKALLLVTVILAAAPPIRAAQQTWESAVSGQIAAQARLIRAADLGSPAYRPQALDALLDLTSREAAAGRRPVVMFDLDDTLVDTGYRQLAIVKEFAAQPQARGRFPDAAAKMAAARYSDVRYELGDTLATLGVEDPAVLPAFTTFWAARFFDNRYLLLDRANPGGVDYVLETLRRGGTVVYLTGRWQEMRPGTEASLAAMGYPSADGARVILMMKPDRRQTDIAFKRVAFDEISRLGEVVGGFENEPANVNAYQERFVSGIYVFLDTRHSRTSARPAPGIAWVGDFRRAAVP